MLKKVIHKLLKKRHFWRDASFDELSELYVSMIFRSVAIGSIGVFVPIYLYQLDYSLAEIISVYAWFATAQALFSLINAKLVAHFGPKHIILVSYILQLLSSLLFLTLGTYFWPLPLLGCIWGVAVNMFFIPYHVDFSKIKHNEHSGKEVGYMYMMQKIGLTIGPLLGGVVATLFGANYVFLIACILLAIGVMPLFKTGEAVHVRQRLDFNLPFQKIKYDLRSHAAFHVEDILTKIIWPAYIGIFVLGKNVFAKLGVLASVSVAISIATTYSFGKLADKQHGHRLIRIFAYINSAIHLARPFVTNVFQIIGINIANDVATIGYTLPYIKGMYAAADDLPGFRIVYIAIMEMIGSASRAFVCWSLAIIAIVAPMRTTLVVGFIVAAIASLLITTERFSALSVHKS